MVLRAAEYSARAEQLEQLPRIETPADADDAAQLVDALAWDFDDRTDAQIAAREAIGEMRRAIDVAASDPENREAEVSEVDGWCFTFEGFEQLRDPTMEILRLAVRTGLPKQRAVDDGLAHLQRLARRAHGEPLD